MKTVKKILGFTLTLVVLASLLNLGAFAASVSSDFVVEYGILKGYNGSGGDVVIPGDRGITTIGYQAFYNKNNITSVTIPEGVSKILFRAFWGCSLNSVSMPQSLLLISRGSFMECKNLKSITIPESVTSIEDEAFVGCTALEEAVLPAGIKQINNALFYQCKALTSVNIPESVTSIGNSAFYMCSSLKSITIPGGVTSIGNYAFGWCSGLKSISIPNSVTSIGIGAFAWSGIETPIFVNNGKVLCYVPTSFLSYTIPGTVTAIGNGAFYDNPNITSIVIPDGVTSIGIDAFRRCIRLKSVQIPDSVISIGDSAFYGCSILKSINIPKTTVIGDQVFVSCGMDAPMFSYDGSQLYFVPTYLTKYTVPDTVTKIGSGAFSQCRNLSSVTLPYGVTDIGSYAFSDCGIKTISIPSSLRTIGSYAFYRCSGLTELNIPYGVTSIGDCAFLSSGLTSVKIPSSITAISFGMFESCTNLKSVTIADSVTSIGKFAFSGCKSLVSITIPDSVKFIDSFAFENCTALTGISIPGSVTSIGEIAFNGCSSLKSVIIQPGTTEIINSFISCPNVTIYGTNGSYAERYASVKRIPFSPIAKPAAATSSTVTVNGKSVKFEVYNFDDYNYFKLRDLAVVLSGTEKQFEVTYDEASGKIALTSKKPYTSLGGELTVGASAGAAANFNLAVVYLDGAQYTLQAYEIGGYNYVKLRDLAAVISFGVTYSETTDSIAINAATGYTA